MSPVTLERAIRAFCSEACIDRAQVHAMPIGSKVAIWVSLTPNEPSASNADNPNRPNKPRVYMAAYA